MFQQQGAMNHRLGRGTGHFLQFLIGHHGLHFRASIWVVAFGNPILEFGKR